jgi:hypothetical protein
MITRVTPAPNVWTYRGVNVYPAGSNVSGIRWTAYSTRALRADSKAGMRELIRAYGVTP